jgi:hypothetical protein
MDVNQLAGDLPGAGSCGCSYAVLNHGPIRLSRSFFFCNHTPLTPLLLLHLGACVQVRLRTFTGGDEVTSPTPSPPWPSVAFSDGTWRTIRLEMDNWVQTGNGNNQWRVYVNSALVFTYNQPNGKAWLDGVTGPAWFISAFTGASTVDASIRNVNICGVEACECVGVSYRPCKQPLAYV